MTHANGTHHEDIELTALEDIEAEQTVLGAILFDPNHMINLAARLKPEDFAHGIHQVIYAGMVDLYHRRIAPDILSVRDWANENGHSTVLADHSILVDLHQSHLAMRDPSYAAERVVDRSRRRHFFNLVNTAATNALDITKPTQDVLTGITDEIARIHESGGYRMFQSAAELADSAFERYQQGPEPSIKTGFTDLDYIIGGFKQGQLIVPAARPGNGKSAMQAQMLYHQVKAGHRVGLVTLEMTADEIFDRVVAFHSGVDMNYYRTERNIPQNVHDNVMTAVGQLAEMPFYIDGHCSGTLQDTMSRAKLMHTTQHIEVLYVDYLQLVTSAKKENRTQEVSEISRGLKRLARQLEIPVVAASQLSRTSENREPILSDLRESGSIEQDSDIVIFIHRPDKLDESAQKNVAKILVAKHRNGPEGGAKFTWRPETAKFEGYHPG